MPYTDTPTSSLDSRMLTGYLLEITDIRQNRPMIHRFQVSNFQCLRDPVQLDFRIRGTTPDLPCFQPSFAVPEVRLPSVVTLIGPNGSGKTTLLRAISYLVWFVTRTDEQEMFFPFLSEDAWTEPTIFEAEFDIQWPFSTSIQDHVLCRYRLEVERDGIGSTTSVGYEALHIFPNGRPRRIMERRKEQPTRVANEFGLRPGDERLRSIPPKVSAIAALAWMGVSAFSQFVEDLSNTMTNIAGADPWKPDTETVTRFYQNNPDAVDAVSERLGRFDVGIEGMDLVKMSDGRQLLMFKHRGLQLPIQLIAESSGTRHLVHLFPDLSSALKTGHPAIMDALDSGFHTDLAMELLDQFRRTESNPHRSQLICSLHNLSVLDDLEKEEVFIVEKARDGATRAYGARDIAGLRRGVNLQKLYRSGALGGLPSFG